MNEKKKYKQGKEKGDIFSQMFDYIGLTWNSINSFLLQPKKKKKWMLGVP